MRRVPEVCAAVRPAARLARPAAMWALRAAIAVGLPALVWAQAEYEIGGAIGYGAYRSARVESPAGNATVGIRNRFVAGAVVCQDKFEHLSGEFRYLYQDGDPYVSGSGVRGNVQGQSHAVDYSLLFHAKPRDSRLRPYFAVGGGGKYYRVSGPEPAVQPLPDIVTLTNRSQWRWLVTVGVGVKYRLRRDVLLRFDFKDYLTPFPHGIFVAAPGGTGRGIFNQLTPMVGISYSFEPHVI